MPRLLLIDDSLADSAQFMQMLAQNGYLVEHVTTLAEGIERTRHREFDTLLLDLNLPDHQGISTYLAAREQLPQMPIVVLTDPTDDSTVSLAYSRGAQDFLIKSLVTPDWLVQSVKHAVFRGQLLEAGEVPPTDPTPGSSAVWSQEKVDEVIVLRLIPRRLLETSVILAIEERLTSLVEAGNHHLVVSLENVEYISNAALGVLIGVQKKMRHNNGRLHLANLRQNVQNQLGARQFHRLFQIYEDVDSAVASIAATSS